MEKREIKVRAWNHIVERMSDFYTLEQLHKEKINFDNCTFMQFTGLTDINGTYIFEGDIVKRAIWSGKTKKYITKTGEVKWHDESASYLFCIGWYLTLIADNIDLEVIGNIYQNKNLLTP